MNLSLKPVKDIASFGIEFEWECEAENERERSYDHDGCPHSHIEDGFCDECSACGYHCELHNCFDGDIYNDRANCDLRRTRLIGGINRYYCQRCHVHSDDCDWEEEYDDDYSEVAYPDRSSTPMAEYAEATKRLAPLPQDWEIKPDGSLEHGFEVTTPICFFKDWPSEKLHQVLTRIFNGMERHGCSAENSCGTHIHIGQPLYPTAFEKWKWQRRLVLSVANNEDLLYELAIGDRRGHRGQGYCLPVSERKLATAQDVLGGHGLNIGGHYDGVSLNSNYPTVEWRIFNGTLNSSIATAWLVLCRQFMRYTVSNPPLPPLDNSRLLLSTIGVEREELRYFNEFYDFGMDKAKSHTRDRSTLISRQTRNGVVAFDKARKRVTTARPPATRESRY